MTERVSLRVHSHVAVVSLNRPDKRNAIDKAMFAALIDAGRQLARERGVRAVVLHGTGGNFSAGIDIAAFTTNDTDGIDTTAMAPEQGTPANFFQAAAWVWRELPVPVIAAIDGCCFGAGMQIAAAADMRYASPDARLSIMEIKWGLVPDMGLSVTLRDVVAVDRIKELAYTGRIISGRDGAAVGLVTGVREDPLAAARDLAAEIAEKSPDSVRAVKRLVNQGWHEPVASALRLEAELQLRLLASPNQREAVAANLARRKPEFTDQES